MRVSRVNNVMSQGPELRHDFALPRDKSESHPFYVVNDQNYNLFMLDIGSHHELRTA
jgi:hypothetical protein